MRRLTGYSCFLSVESLTWIVRLPSSITGPVNAFLVAALPPSARDNFLDRLEFTCIYGDWQDTVSPPRFVTSFHGPHCPAYMALYLVRYWYDSAGCEELDTGSHASVNVWIISALQEGFPDVWSPTRLRNLFGFFPDACASGYFSFARAAPLLSPSTPSSSTKLRAVDMASHVQSYTVRPSRRYPGGAHRHSRSAMYLMHIPTLEPMIDEETEDEDDASSPPSTNSRRGEERERTSLVDDLSPCYQVSPSPTGGSGLFATRPIPQGALVFSETPLLTQPLSPARTNSTILNILAQRTREEQCAFFALFNAHKTDRPGRPALLPALGIFETNALPCGTTLPPASSDATEAKTSGSKDTEAGKAGHAGTDGGREGIFLSAARLNHSCRPNVWRTWDVSSQEMTFRALRDIAQGEELCMNYADVDILGTREERAAEIQEAFGFVCACEVCALKGKEGRESDRRRADIKRLFEEIGTCGKEATIGLRKVCIESRAHLSLRRLIFPDF